MATKIILPKLGMNMETAIIARWYKHEGDTVAVGEVLAEVETDKVNMELESEAAGLLRTVLAAEGETVAVNQPIAIIAAVDEDISGLLAAPAAPEEAVTHKERVYETWHEQARSASVTPGRAAGAARPAARPVHAAAGPNGRRLDPEAIRSRLAARGVVPLVEEQPVEPARQRIVVYGAGLGARQILELTRHLDAVAVIGLIDDDPALAGTTAAGVPILGGFAALAELAARRAIDGVALSFHSNVRQKVHQRVTAELGLRLVPLIDPRATIGMDAQIGDGALVEAGAVVGPGTVIGEGAIVDVGAIVAHDCFLGPFSHLSPGCCLSGVVCLQENVLVGVGAAINSTVTVGRNVIIAPGAAVMNDVPDDVVVSGVPAKVIGQSQRGGAAR